MKIKLIIVIMVALLILCSLSSCKIFGKKDLIGRISEDGKKYIALNDLFSLNSKRYSTGRNLFNDIMIKDENDNNGYRLVYSSIGEIIDELFIFRNHTDYEEFMDLAQKRVDSVGDWSEIKYSNVSQTDDFTLYSIDYNIVGLSPYSKLDKKYKSTLSVLFCYNDSIQFVLSRFIYADASFGDAKEKERRGKYSERRLKFILNNNLELNDKLFVEGVPEPLTKEELKVLKKSK